MVDPLVKSPEYSLSLEEEGKTEGESLDISKTFPPPPHYPLLQGRE